MACGCGLQSVTLNLPLSHSKSWFTARNLQTTWVLQLFPKVLWVNRSRPICPTASPWKSRVRISDTLQSSSMCSRPIAQLCSPSHPPSPLLPPLYSPRPDLHCAGPGPRAAGEAAGAFSRCEGCRDRTSRDGPQVLPRGSLPDAEGVGRERVTCWRGRERRNDALALVARVVGRSEKDAPGTRSRGAGDKVRHSVILHRAPGKKLMKPSIVPFRDSVTGSRKVCEVIRCCHQQFYFYRNQRR